MPPQISCVASALVQDTREGIHKYLWIDGTSHCGSSVPISRRPFPTSEWLSSISTTVCNRCHNIFKSMMAALLNWFHSLYRLLIVEKNSRFCLFCQLARCYPMLRTWIKQVVCGKSSRLLSHKHTHTKNLYHTHPLWRTFSVCPPSHQQATERRKRPSRPGPSTLWKLFPGHLPPSSGKNENEDEINQTPIT